MRQFKVKQLVFDTSQQAWEGINEAFITNDDRLFSDGEGSYISGGKAAYVYNVMIIIKKPEMEPDFDFGKCFNYQMTKWRMLVNNYVNLNKLDLLRSKVRDQLNKNYTNYNLTFLFDNKHSSGKGCLISLTFSKRNDMDIPVLVASLRSSEITKRLAFDLLLIQRIGEYVYGEERPFMIQLHATQMYCNAETIIMYDVYKKIKRLTKHIKNKSKWTQNIIDTLEHFKTCDEKVIKYKVHRRTLAVLRPGEVTAKKVQTLFTKDLLLPYDNIPYPETCITLTERTNFKKKYLKQQAKLNKS